MYFTIYSYNVVTVVLKIYTCNKRVGQLFYRRGYRNVFTTSKFLISGIRKKRISCVVILNYYIRKITTLFTLSNIGKRDYYDE